MNPAVRQQILISYSVLAGILAAILVLVVWPALAARAELLASIESSRDVHRRSMESIAESEALADDTSWAIDAASLLSAETDALAAAELQQTIASIIEREGATLISTAYRRETDTLPLVAVPVPVRLRSSVESLPRILAALETHEPRLYIADLAIQSRHRPGRQLQDLTEELDIQLEVRAYMWPAEAAP